MQIVTNYPNGVFNWVDLTTTDIAGAKAFYMALFGWEAVDTPFDGGGFYSNFKLNGHSVAGGGQMDQGMLDQGIPPYWGSYVKHDNADEIAARISAAGGTLVLPPMDVMEEGRMLIAIDPTGATFGVWQPRNHTGAELVNIPNTLIWNELQTRDSAAAQTFYGSVFGWTAHPTTDGYTNFAVNGRVQAGVIQMDERFDASIPPNWSIYFAVEDAAATVARAEELGGKTMVPPTAAGEMGTFAVIQDPQGAVFSIIQMNSPGDPPPGV
ncbi:MAG: VOC family protein [Anaerolineae bacterium]|nr:VOC family protein [Anaerolineae bacterium]